MSCALEPVVHLFLGFPNCRKQAITFSPNGPDIREVLNGVLMAFRLTWEAHTQ
jgi:hypothetical protein